jgi:hypothetical protein
VLLVDVAIQPFVLVEKAVCPVKDDITADDHSDHVHKYIQKYIVVTTLIPANCVATPGEDGYKEQHSERNDDKRTNELFTKCD